MTNEVELAPDGVTLRIRFAYRPDLVDLVKTLPDRRFDGGSKTWSVPARHAEAVYAKLSRHLFAFAPEVMSIVAGTMGAPKATTAPKKQPETVRDADDKAATTPPDTLTVSALNERIKEALVGNFAQRVWVVGEVSDFDKGAGKQHKYFTFVEKADGESRPKARIDAVIWDGKAKELFRRLAQQSPDFTMRDGIEIRAQVKVDFYVPTGKVSLHVEDIDPAFTLGKLALNREQILRALREQGLDERNKSLPLPIPPLRIGVLTSPDADGWNDFKKHLEGSGVGFDVTLFPVAVQGDRTRPTVLAGLAWFAERAEQFDCLCILRGGGSRTDLAWFDDMEIAVAVATHPIKALIGIGHERDRSVLDEIAHSEKTPTAVAAHLVDVVLGERDLNRDRALRLQRGVGSLLQQQAIWLSRATSALAGHANARLAAERHRLVGAARQLATGAVRTLVDARRDLADAARNLQSAATQRCDRERGALLRAADRGKNGAERMLERARTRLDRMADKHRLLDPRGVLLRGFALLRDERGRVLPSASRVTTGQPITIQMRDGSVRARAESVEKQP